MADTFDHTPQIWTAGHLRAALSGLPDDTPVHVGIADEPGDFTGYGEYVLVGAEPVEMELNDVAGRDARLGTQTQFTLFADATAGAYYRDMS